MVRAYNFPKQFHRFTFHVQNSTDEFIALRNLASYILWGFARVFQV